MTESPRRRILAELDRRDVDLPDRLRMHKIRERAFACRFEPDDSLAFRLERHPTMYFSEGGLPGLDASPARFHVLKEYRLDLSDETWTVTEHDATFDYEEWMVLEAELGKGRVTIVRDEDIEAVRNADDPEAAFEESLAWAIDHWEEKFGDVHGRPVPPEDRDAIVSLLVDELRARTGLD